MQNRVPDVADAEKIRIPYICLFSPQDGERSVLDAYGAVLKKRSNSYVEVFENMQHGWMSARADLSDEKGRKEFERGYARLAEFYAEHLPL